MITSRQIEAFRAVMVMGTVTQAAGMLFLSQPAVSRMVRDLEYEIGFKLFVRARRQLIPTEEGRLFFDEVERAFIGLDQIAKTADAIREYRHGQFRLITIPSLASTVMPDLIARFVKRYPAASISLEVQPSQRMFKWIASQQCDIGLTTLPTEDGAIETRSLARGEAVCVLPKNHALAGKKKIRPKDFEGESFISYQADSFSRHIVDEVFQGSGVQRNLNIEARTSEAICGMVAAGLGVSVIGPAFPGADIPPDVVVRSFEPVIPIELRLLYPAHKPLSRMAEQFIVVVDEYVEAKSGRLLLPRGMRGKKGG